MAGAPISGVGERITAAGRIPAGLVLEKVPGGRHERTAQSFKKREADSSTSPAWYLLFQSLESSGKDAHRAVFFSQLARALLSRTWVQVADVKLADSTEGTRYCSKVIPGFTPAPLLERVSVLESADRRVEAFFVTGRFDVLMAAKLLRDDDLCPGNVGEVLIRVKEQTHSIAAVVDFDHFGHMKLEPSSAERTAWGLGAGGLDNATWIPPAPARLEEGAPYLGPRRWVDRGYGSPTTRNTECWKAQTAYFRTQAEWRLVWHKEACVHRGFQLAVKLWVILMSGWSDIMRRGYLGGRDEAADGTSDLDRRARQIRDDLQYAFSSSALFRLYFWMHEDACKATLQQAFEAYNAGQKTEAKSGREKYRLVVPEASIETLKTLLFSPPGETADADQILSYLQFLVLVSAIEGAVTRLSPSRERQPEAALAEQGREGELLGRLDPARRHKLLFQNALFGKFSGTLTYSQAFFLLKVFEAFYPTLTGVKQDAWYRFGGVPVTIDGVKKRFYFPGQGSWVFRHFSVDALTSDEARERFPNDLTRVEKIGAMGTREESRASMAALVRMPTE